MTPGRHIGSRIRIGTALGLGTAAFLVYAWTGAPGVTGWESGELITAAHVGGVPQAPSGLGSLVPAQWWLALPMGGSVARRLVLWHGFLSAAVVALAFLFVERMLLLLVEDRAALAAPRGGEAVRSRDRGFAMAAAAITTAAFALSESFWMNAGIVEPHNPQLLFNAAALLLAAGPVGAGERSLWSIAATGIAVGIATTMGDLWMYTLAPILLLLVRRHALRVYLSGIGLALVAMIAAVAGWPRAVASLPLDAGVVLVSSPAVALLMGAILAALVFSIAAILLHRLAPRTALHRMLVPIATFCIGVSLNALVPARASEHPAVPGPARADAAALTEYFATPGPGQGPDMFARRRTGDAAALDAWTQEESEFGYFVRVQLQDQLARYTFWNAIGRANDRADAAPAIAVRDNDGDPMLLEPVAAAYPSSNFGIPLVLVAVGMLWSLRRMRRTALALTVLLVVTGPLAAFGLNLPGQHPRPFDGMYVPFFFAAVPMAAAGLFALARVFRSRGPGIGLLSLAAVLPLWMAHAGHRAHDRSGDVTIPIFARGLLASCDSNAVLYTAGDNDTWPVMHAQHVEGLRGDVRVIAQGDLDVPLDSAVRLQEKDTPIHFSAACDPESLEPFADKLRVEGLTVRLTRTRVLNTPRVHAERTRRALDACGGLPREASVDAVGRAAAALIRETCLRLADYEFRVRGRAASCDQALDRYEHIAPARAYPLDARDALDAAVLARESMCTARADRLFTAIERACLRAMAAEAQPDVSLQSAARVLLEAYRFEHRYDDALALLARLARAHPRAADITRARAEITRARADAHTMQHADSTYSTHHTVPTP